MSNTPSMETLFLAQLIHNAPNGASWIISSDSWEDIKEILHPIETAESETEWIVKINEVNKQALVKLVSAYDLGLTIIHMNLLSAEGIKLVTTYDHMTMIIVNNEFNKLFNFSSQFPSLEIYLS